MTRFDAKTGTVSFEGSPFANGAIHFALADRSVDSSALSWKKTKSGFAAAVDGLEFAMELSGDTVSVEFKNKAKAAVSLKSVSIIFDPKKMESPLSCADWMEFIHTHNFEKPCGVKRVGLAGTYLPSNPESAMLYLLRSRRTGCALLLAALPPHHGDFTRFKARHDAPHQEGTFGVEITFILDCLVKPGTTVRTSSICCAVGDDPHVLLAEYGEKWRKALGSPLKPKTVGWNSWDYFSGAVTAADIHRNHDAMRKLFTIKAPRIVIDEGYEPRWGVWQANWKFPEGLKGFCARVSKGGGVPGVWTAPLMVNSYTDFYRDHPECFGRNAEGAIATKLYSYGPMAFLDPTHPKSAEFLDGVFRSLKKDGFRYFKVDFTQEVLNATVFSDRAVPRGGIIRRAFEIIRNAIGKDAYLLACGASYESVTGLVDACRTTGDIHNFWSHVMANAAGMAGRYWMQGNLWNNDPDFLIVRTPETCSLPRMNREFPPRPFNAADYWLAGRELNYEEAKVYALLIHLSGGDVFLSDDLPTLNKKGIGLLTKALERPLTAPAVPLDLFESHHSLPAVWLAEEKNRYVLGIINWQEDPAEISASLEELGVESFTQITNFWDGKEAKGCGDGEILAVLEPRTCAAFVIEK